MKQSLTNEVKSEILAQKNAKNCCKNAEVAAISGGICEQVCPECARGIIRGAFLAGGRVAAPKANGNSFLGEFNLEIAAQNEAQAQLLCQILSSQLNIGEFKLIEKSGKPTIYTKKQEEICDILTLVGAHKTMLKLLDIIMLRKIRADANRGANCINANLERASEAALAQIKAIELLRQKGKLELLPQELLNLARLRLQCPELSLSELAEALKISKSGVKHRFNRIIELSQD